MFSVRVAAVFFLALPVAAPLSAQWPRESCEGWIRELPPQPPSPFPKRPLSCEGADDIVKAAWNNCVPEVQGFLERGVSADSADEEGRTALAAAAQGGFAEVARMLLDAGADPTGYFRDRSALCWGANSTEVTRLFLERGLLDKLESSCAYLVTYSAWGDADLVSDLIAAGLSIERTGYQDKTPAMNAQTFHNYSVFAALLEAGANPNATSSRSLKLSMLHTADPVELCLLLQHGGDPNIRDANRETPLMWAAMLASEWNLRLLLGEGADQDLQDSEGRTALMHALTGDLQLQHSRVRAEAKEALALLLLKAGADPTIRDNEGRNALDYAEKHGLRKAAALLRQSLQPTTR